MNIIDFTIGVLLMNAMPHFIFGITNTKFLGMFGFSPTRNIMYGVIQFIICLSLYHLNHHISNIYQNGIFLGCSIVLILYLVFGKIVLKLYNKQSS
ncbi:hypothetical protein B1H38_11425 [Leptospira borgpetersenii serovar Ballum]|nr:hypothetical protein IQ66_19025 [Leptospira borgpetersenii serovar Ballum]OOV43645.1 hypothetical protein B1H38_11425 [Leptospira borgpetersenii serovar Ballum]